MRVADTRSAATKVNDSTLSGIVMPEVVEAEFTARLTEMRFW
jgi:hypothetical protein